MLIIYNRIFPLGKKFYAINLFGVLFAKRPCDQIMINHEKIHSRQIIELLWIPFYLIYCFEWLIKLIYYRNGFEAYKNLSFEREAYKNQDNLSYLKKRKLFSFLKYL